MDYLWIKWIHLGSVVASYALFFVRGIWMMRDSPVLSQRWVKTVPHVVDSVLLAAAVTLAIMSRQYPFQADWLTAKVLGLVVYVALGTIALKRGRTKGVRIAAWTGAQLVFGYIVAVALTRNPWVVA